MALSLTPDMLRAAYDFLCMTQPFSKWNLPDGEDVKFRVVRDPALRGWYTCRMRSGALYHIIGISSRNIGHTQNLIATMAHEMIHLHEAHAGMCKANVQHSAAFNKLAERVCKIHGFDVKLF